MSGGGSERIDAALRIMRVAAHAVGPERTVNYGAAPDLGRILSTRQAVPAQLGKTANGGIYWFVPKSTYGASSLPWAVTCAG
jgi:hypothetical protein